MTDLLRVSMIQANLIWGDVHANLEKFESMLLPLQGCSDLIVLPEMFTSGFSIEGKERVAQYSQYTREWMHNMAHSTGAFLLGSIVESEGNNYFNRLFVIGPKGECQWYDKRHLFRMGQEDKHFEAGKNLIIADIKGWRIRPLICYDLRFPVWSRNRNDYDLLIYVANWPESRRDVWQTLLKARAIENQACVVGVNRVGEDGMHLKYGGDSVALDAKGNMVGLCRNYKEEIVTVTFSMSKLSEFRTKFQVGQDADSFDLHY